MSWRKWIAYLIGFALGCVILVGILRNREPRAPHPWHAQTAPEGTYPLTVTDAYGRAVEIVRQPRFIISLAPSITEILFAMDMGDHLLAVSRWCDYPAEARALRDSGASIGGIDRPDREAIAAYRPDLILGSTLTPPEIFPLLESPPRTRALALRHESVEEILADIRTIGRILGVPGHALRLLQRMQAEAAAVDTAIAALPPPAVPPAVLFLLSIEPDLQPGWVPGKGTWIDDLILRAKARNVAADLGKSWGALSLESLLALNPEILIVRDSQNPAEAAQLRETLAGLAQHPVWRHVTAVHDQRIHIVPHGPLNIPGPRLMQAYAAIAAAIWPNADLPAL